MSMSNPQLVSLPMEGHSLNGAVVVGGVAADAAVPSEKVNAPAPISEKAAVIQTINRKCRPVTATYLSDARQDATLLYRICATEIGRLA